MGFAVVFQITSSNRRKNGKILGDWVHTTVVRGNLENCSEPGETFTQSCAEEYEGVLHFTA